MPTVFTRTVALRPDQWDWLRAKDPRNLSRAVRDAVDAARANEKAEAPEDPDPIFTRDPLY